MLLKRSIELSQSRPATIRITSFHETVDLEHEGFTAEFFQDLQSSRNPALAATRSDIDPEFATGFNAFLRDSRCLVSIPADQPLVPANVAAQLVSRELDFWVDMQHCDEFWQRMLEPRSSSDSDILYGWAAESAHYTHSVLAHLGSVLVHIDEFDAASKCIQHLSEEWDHPHLFSLSAARYLREKRRMTVPGGVAPLAGTTGLTNLLRMAARDHLFVYKCCVAVLEKTARRVEETRHYFAGVARANALGQDVVDPIIRHAETDEHYDHLNSLEAFSQVCPPLRRETVANAIKMAYQFAEAIYLWQCHMLDWYLSQPLGARHSPADLRH